MKSTKNLKPVYAVNLGNGVFAGVMWMCVKCGKQFNYNSTAPSPQAGGKCPDTASGNHVWQKC